MSPSLAEAAARYFGKHERIALQFSGGKDSLACLHLLRPYWDRLTVAWCNTGAAFPETIDQMQRIQAMVPHFLEIKTNQPAQIKKMGLPSDIVPVRNTVMGRAIQPHNNPLLQNYLDCCWANFWFPMQQAMVNLGATLLIRGQRAAESRRAPFTSGYQQDGMTVWFPIEDWTDQQVFDFLHAEAVEIPAHYQYTKASLDCHSCTAYLDEGIGKMRYIHDKHPEFWKEHRIRLATVRDALKLELARKEYREANLLIDMID